MSIAIVVVAALLQLGAAYTPEALADQITALPGAESLTIPFKQFSGYIDVPGVSTKHMHYWLVESASDPANDPVAFWTNGGPGCSGLLGFMTEQGPFRPLADGTLKLNEFAWNQKANMVFIEAPCGVGFSYSDNKDDYDTGDKQTAEDNYAFIQGFMTRFPEYAKNSLYISSESYGGHYMPTLAKEIVDRNTEGKNPILNFKGFAVGNPFTTVYSAIPSGMFTYWGRQLVSKPSWDRYSEVCLAGRKIDFAKCETAFLELYFEIGDLNPYALDYPVCTSGDPRLRSGRAQRNALMRHILGNSSVAMQKAVGLDPAGSYDPCVDNYAVAYLNRPEVKTALHVNPSVEWAECSRSIRYKQTDSFHPVTGIYNYLIDGNYGLDILVFSGDDDGVCPTEGTQDWIWDLGYTPSGRRWQPYKVNDQVAGYLTKWTKQKLAFATVHGAGHEVPTYKPEIALSLWTQYLNGELTN